MSEEYAVRFWKSLFALTEQIKDRTFSLKHLSKEWNITMQQLHLLRTIDHLIRNGMPDGVMLKTLAEELDVTSASVSGMVETLVKRGILSRQQAQTDRRAVRITLSADSLKKMKQVEMIFTEITEYILPILGSDQIAEITTRLEKISSEFDNKVPALEELIRLHRQKKKIKE